MCHGVEPPSPLSYQQDRQQTHTRAPCWGGWGRRLPQLMRSCEITKTRQGPLGCKRAAPCQDLSRKRAPLPKDTKQFSCQIICPGSELLPYKFSSPTPQRAPYPPWSLQRGGGLKARPGRGPSREGRVLGQERKPDQ